MFESPILLFGRYDVLGPKSRTKHSYDSTVFGKSLDFATLMYSSSLSLDLDFSVLCIIVVAVVVRGLLSEPSKHRKSGLFEAQMPPNS